MDGEGLDRGELSAEDEPTIDVPEPGDEIFVRLTNHTRDYGVLPAPLWLDELRME